MADLTRDRGQLLLAGAFVLAVSLVALTLVFTASSYTATLANQETHVDRGSDAVAVRESLDADLTRQFEFAFQAYSAGNRKDPFRAVVRPMGNETNTHYARRGRLVNVTMESSEAGFIEGTRVRQGDSSTLTNPNGGPDWIVAKNVELRNATIVITNIATGATSPNTAINISFDTPASAGGNWSLTFHRDKTVSPAELVIRTRAPDGTIRTCRRQDPNSPGDVLVDLDKGTAGGSQCDALLPIDPGREAYDVNVTRGDQANGKYWLIVDKSPGNLDNTFDVDSISAKTEPVLYGARVTYRYHSATVSYETTIDVAPEEMS